jgi:chemotaxis protein methyltransferase CheR
VSGISAPDFQFVAGLVRQRSAIDLQPGKEYLVESRLAPVARDAGERDVTALVARLRRGDDTLTASVVDALTTNETSWFRDAHPFQAFSRRLLPEVAETSMSKQITIWSAACSSGQEAYSLAMLVHDWLPMHPGFSVRIVGTDISAKMVERARSGRYSQLEVNRGLPAAYLVKYFDQAGREWVAKPTLRSMTRFEKGNLAAPGVRPADLRHRLPPQRPHLLRHRDEADRPRDTYARCCGPADSSCSAVPRARSASTRPSSGWSWTRQSSSSIREGSHDHVRGARRGTGELDAIVIDVLGSILDEEAAPAYNELPDGQLAWARLAIHDAADDSFAVTEVRVGIALARVLAGRMMYVADPVDEDVFDAVAELGNICAGNVKSLVCHDARLSLPTAGIGRPSSRSAVPPSGCARSSSATSSSWPSPPEHPSKAWTGRPRQRTRNWRGSHEDPGRRRQQGDADDRRPHPAPGRLQRPRGRRGRERQGGPRADPEPQAGPRPLRLEHAGDDRHRVPEGAARLR